MFESSKKVVNGRQKMTRTESRAVSHRVVDHLVIFPAHEMPWLDDAIKLKANDIWDRQRDGCEAVDPDLNEKSGSRAFEGKSNV